MAFKRCPASPRAASYARSHVSPATWVRSAGQVLSEQPQKYRPEGVKATGTYVESVMGLLQSRPRGTRPECTQNGERKFTTASRK